MLEGIFSNFISYNNKLFYYFIRLKQHEFRNINNVSVYIFLYLKIVKNRNIEVKFTFPVFLNLKYTYIYDSIPTKLYKLEFRRKVSQIFKKSLFTIKMNLFNEFQIHCGVQQGYPLSSILFNL